MVQQRSAESRARYMYVGVGTCTPRTVMKPVNVRCTLQVTSELSEPSNQCRSPYYIPVFYFNVSLGTYKRYM